MTISIKRVESLKKVQLSIDAKQEAGKKLFSEPKYFSFIFGSSSNGLCPLELALIEKREGDVINMELTPTNMNEFCSHLLKPLRQTLELQILPNVLSLTCTIVNIEDADNKEIVQAIAQSIGNDGCGGDCDCGCSC